VTDPGRGPSAGVARTGGSRVGRWLGIAGSRRAGSDGRRRP